MTVGRARCRQTSTKSAKAGEEEKKAGRISKNNKELVELIITTAIAMNYPDRSINRMMTDTAEEMRRTLDEQGAFAAINVRGLKTDTIMNWLRDIPAERKKTRTNTRVRATAPPAHRGEHFHPPRLRLKRAIRSPRAPSRRRPVLETTRPGMRATPRSTPSTS